MNSFQDRFKRTGGPDPAPQQQPASGPEDAPPQVLADDSSQPQSSSTVGEEELVLVLGDFLHRIPSRLLAPNPPDVRRELRFPLTEIANWIAQRVTSIPLKAIYERAPDIFVANGITGSEMMEVRFPWQKVLHLINETASLAPADSLAVKLKTKCTIENVIAAQNAMPPPGPPAAPSPSANQPEGTWLSRALKNTRPGSAGVGGRTPQEYQRTITELNRRIIALETTQKERAQELTKEREHRLKLERQLTSTDRALQESAARVENTRVDARREHEIELRRREAEHARALKEQQKQIELLKEELGHVREECDDLRDKVKGPGQPSDGWESPAVMRLNAEISECRERIQSLMDDREKLQRENQELLQEVEALRTPQA